MSSGSRARAGPGVPAVVAAMTLALAAQYGDALRMPFLGDDYSILDKTRTASFLSLWTRQKLLYYWWRPWSRELHYWTLQHLAGMRVEWWHLASFALWPAILALYFLIARRLNGARAAAFACACVAALAAWAGTLMWVAGVQELWMLLFALAFIWLFARRSIVPSIVAFVLALLSKETAGVLPGIALAWALLVDRDRIGRALGRIAPFVTIAVAWVKFHPWLATRLSGTTLGHTEIIGRPSTAGVALRFVLSLVNLDQWPHPEGGWGPALLGGLIGIAVLIAFGAWALLGGRSREAATVAAANPPAPRNGALAIAWTAIAALPLLVPSIGWHAYYGLLAAFGAWLGLGAWLARTPRIAALVLAAIAILRPLRADTPSWDWSSKSYQMRAGFYLGRLRDDLLHKHPTLEPHTRLYFAQVPQNIGLVVGDGAAFRVWYRDTTLRAGFLSEYRPRAADAPQGQDLFFRFDTTVTWTEIVKGPESRDAMAGDPTWEDNHRMLAHTLGVAGDWRGAAGELAKLADAYPRNVEYPLNLGEVLERAGDPVGAERAYLRALQVPDAPTASRTEASARLARLHGARGASQ